MPPSKSSRSSTLQGRTRYFRLVTLLTEEGTTILKELFDYIIPPANLATTLNKKDVHLGLTKLRRKRVLNEDQWKLLFPPAPGCVQSKDFDITLLYTLFRQKNICRLKPPSTGWNKLPKNTDVSLAADIVRIRYYRNIVSHINENMAIRMPEFKNYWAQVKDSLLRIVRYYSPSGSSDVKEWEEAIDDLLTDPIVTTEDFASGLESHVQEKPHGVFTLRCVLKLASVGAWLGGTLYVLNRIKNNLDVQADFVQNIFSDGISVGRIDFGSIMVQLRAERLDAMDELRRRYDTGELRAELERFMVTEELKSLADGESIEFTVEIDEEEYITARQYLDMKTTKEEETAEGTPSKAKEEKEEEMTVLQETTKDTPSKAKEEKEEEMTVLQETTKDSKWKSTKLTSRANLGICRKPVHLEIVRGSDVLTFHNDRISPKIIFLGQPNAGKTSLLRALTGKLIVIVSSNINNNDTRKQQQKQTKRNFVECEVSHNKCRKSEIYIGQNPDYSLVREKRISLEKFKENRGDMKRKDVFDEVDWTSADLDPDHVDRGRTTSKRTTLYGIQATEQSSTQVEPDPCRTFHEMVWYLKQAHERLKREKDQLEEKAKTHQDSVSVFIRSVREKEAEETKNMIGECRKETENKHEDLPTVPKFRSLTEVDDDIVQPNQVFNFLEHISVTEIRNKLLYARTEKILRGLLFEESTDTSKEKDKENVYTVLSKELEPCSKIFVKFCNCQTDSIRSMSDLRYKQLIFTSLQQAQKTLLERESSEEFCNTILNMSSSIRHEPMKAGTEEEVYQHHFLLPDVKSVFKYEHSIGAIIAESESRVMFAGTCFRIGKEYVITNKHVVDDITQLGISVSNCYVDFNYQEQQAGHCFDFVPDPVLVWSEDLDYALLKLQSDDIRALPYSVTELGFNIAPPGHQLKGGECLSFIGHPGGLRKQMDVSRTIKRQVDDVKEHLVFALKLVNIQEESANFEAHKIDILKASDDPNSAVYDVSTPFGGSSGSPGFLMHEKLLTVMHRGSVPVKGKRKHHVLECGILMSSIVNDVKRMIDIGEIQGLTLDDFFGGLTSSLFDPLAMDTDH